VAVEFGEIFKDYTGRVVQSIYATRTSF